MTRLLLTGTVACLVVVAMGSYIRFANADSLLYPLMSTQRLTFFYWGQDRLANVIPLLASPVSDERANFYVQMTVVGVSFFVLVMLLAWFHETADHRTTTAQSIAATTLVVGLVVIALLEGTTGHTFVFEQQYVVTMVLFVVGMRFVASEAIVRSAVGVVMMAISVLMISSTVLFLPFVWVLVGPGPKRMRKTAVVGAVAAVSFVVASVASSVFYDGPPQSSQYNDFSLGRLPRGLPSAIDNIVGSVHLAPTIAVGIGAVCILVVRRSHLAADLRAMYASSVVFAAGWLLAFSANGWVEANLFGYRYFFPVYAVTIFVITGGLIEGIRMIQPVVGRSRVARWLEVGHRAFWSFAVVLGVVMTWGVIRLQSDGGILVLEEVEADAQAADRLDVEAVIGGYWRVWPAVFAARADGLDVVGITYRAEAIDEEVREVLGRVDTADWPTVQILCADVDEDECLAVLGRFTGQEWLRSDLLSEIPLVISVEPALPLLPRGVDLGALANDGHSIDAALLPGIVGSTIDGTRVADPGSDAPGFLSYGPYARLDQARYRVTFTYSSDAPVNRVDGSFDIAVEGTTIAAADIGGTAGRTASVHIDFDGVDRGGFEFRSLWAGNFGLSVESITIERLGG